MIEQPQLPDPPPGQGVPDVIDDPPPDIPIVPPPDIPPQPPMEDPPPQREVPGPR